MAARRQGSQGRLTRDRTSQININKNELETKGREDKQQDDVPRILEAPLEYCSGPTFFSDIPESDVFT
jgi:hypothetical protein